MRSTFELVPLLDELMEQRLEPSSRENTLYLDGCLAVVQWALRDRRMAPVSVDTPMACYEATVRSELQLSDAIRQGRLRSKLSHMYIWGADGSLFWLSQPAGSPD